MSIRKDDIAHQMGVPADPDSRLPSGRLFKEMLALTLNWLTDEGYTRTLPGSASQKLVLSEKGLRALNAVPPSIGETVGSHLVHVSERTSDASERTSASQIADMVGSFIGGFTKSMSGP